MIDGYNGYLRIMGVFLFVLVLCFIRYVCDICIHFLFLNKMRGLLRLARQGFSSKKLGIADTAKVIQEKIMNITQVVTNSSFRTMSKNSVLSSALETVLLELSDSTKFRLEKWSSSDQVSEVWHSIWKLTTSVSSSSEMIGT